MFRIFTLTAILGIGLFAFVSAQEESKIPAWIKDTASFWVNDQISDQEFITALQYLIDQKVLVVPSSETQTIVIPADEIPNVETLEIPVSNSDIKDKLLSSDLDLLTFKVTQLQELTENPAVIKAVIDSNAKFRAMGDDDKIETYIVEKDKEWKKTPKGQLSPLMGSLIENNVSKILKQKQKIPTEEFGDVIFAEIIVTNEFGANVAITGRTDDYNQGDEAWWIRALKQSVQFRDVLWDDSAQIFSADIVIKIVDENGKFIGVLNAATPVR